MNLQKEQLTHLLQSPAWKNVEDVANELCDRIMYENTLESTEWETLKHTVHNDGQVQGIKRFLKELYTRVQN